METSRKPPNLFNRRELSEKESLQGRILTDLQLALIHADCMNIAEEIINLTYKGKEDPDYALHLAELQGQLGILTYLMELSVSANESLNNPQSEEEL